MKTFSDQGRAASPGIGLLMAPGRLPSCFSGEDNADAIVRPAPPPSVALRHLPGLLRRAVAARREEVRRQSAAAW